MGGKRIVLLSKLFDVNAFSIRISSVESELTSAVKSHGKTWKAEMLVCFLFVCFARKKAQLSFKHYKF